MAKNRIYSLKVFFFSLAIIAVDQISKFYVTQNILLNSFAEPYASFLGGYLNIIHVRNLAIAFSIGGGLPVVVKLLFFKILPLIILLYICYIVAIDRYLRKTQRVALAMIIGGGFGNMIDRIFRPLGVVDFIDTDFWDIRIDWGWWQYEMYRWPTFNIADASILVGISLLFVYSFFFLSKRERIAILENIGHKK